MAQLTRELRNFIIDNFMFGDASGFPLADDDSFIELGIIDSTGILELVGFLEQQYGIRVKDEDLVPENLDSLSRVACFVDSKRHAAAG